MFGKKKKEKEVQSNAASIQNDRFRIHTMEDDLRDIKAGGMQNVSEIVENTAQKESHQEKIKEEQKRGVANEMNSPFLSNSTAQPTQIEEKKEIINNPFFANGQSETATPATNVAAETNQIIHADMVPPVEPIQKSDVPEEKGLSTQGSINKREDVQITPQVVNLKQQNQKNKIAESQKQNPIQDEIMRARQENTELGSIKLHDDSESLQQTPVEQTQVGFGIESGDVNDNTDALLQQFQTEQETQKGRSGLIKMITTIVLVVVILGFIFAGWQWYAKNSQKKTVSVNVPDEIGNEIDNGVKEENPEETMQYYAIDLPNYIVLEEPSTAIADLLREMNIISVNLQAQNIVTPISFLVTDKDDAPYSFRAFAQVIGMNFDDAVFSNMGDNFELYAYDDSGQVRFGIVFDVRDHDAVKEALVRTEIELPKDLKPLFGDIVYDDDGGVFSVSSYQGFDIRFINLDESQLLSVDYTLSNDRVLFATSKETLREIIDRLYPQGLTQ